MADFRAKADNPCSPVPGILEHVQADLRDFHDMTWRQLVLMGPLCTYASGLGHVARPRSWWGWWLVAYEDVRGRGAVSPPSPPPGPHLLIEAGASLDPFCTLRTGLVVKMRTRSSRFQLDRRMFPPHAIVRICAC